MWPRFAAPAPMLLQLVCAALEEVEGAFRQLRFRFQVERDQGLEGADSGAARERGVSSLLRWFKSL